VVSAWRAILAVMQATRNDYAEAPRYWTAGLQPCAALHIQTLLESNVSANPGLNNYPTRLEQ
jgi:hypothetical protein